MLLESQASLVKVLNFQEVMGFNLALGVKAWVLGDFAQVFSLSPIKMALPSHF